MSVEQMANTAKAGFLQSLNASNMSSDLMSSGCPFDGAGVLGRVKEKMPSASEAAAAIQNICSELDI